MTQSIQFIDSGYPVSERRRDMVADFLGLPYNRVPLEFADTFQTIRDEVVSRIPNTVQKKIDLPEDQKIELI